MSASTIKEFVSGFFDGPHATPKPSDDGPIFLGIKNVTPDGRLDLSEIRHVSENEFPRWTRRVTPQKDDLVFTYEATLHRYAIIPEDFHGCLGRRMALMRPDPEKIVPKFLHYYCLSDAWRKEAEASIISGATVDRIPLTKVPDFKVNLPDLSTQKRIAEVLSAYDDLIENNRRRIVLLEEAARLIYHEWFVKLRFPNHENAKFENELPEGWKMEELGNHIELIRDSVQPKDFKLNEVHIGLEHIPRRSFTLSNWEAADSLASQKFRFQESDIIFGKIRPYFHKVGFALRNGLASSDAFIWRVIDPEMWSLILCATTSDNFVAVASKTVREGSKMPRADWNVLKNFKIPVPCNDVLSQVSSQILPISRECKKLALQNHALAKARDLLLPRLMDGRISV